MNYRYQSSSRWAAAGFTAALLTTVSSTALAQTASQSASQAASEARILALESQVQALAAQLQELKESAAVQIDQIADLKSSGAAQIKDLRTAQAATTVSLANGRPTFATADGQFTASIRGVLQFDAALYDQASAGPIATDFRRGSFNDAAENDRARDLNDGTNFRRARLGVEGKAFGAFQYNFIYDFGGSGVEEAGKISSAWLQYNLPTKAPIGLRVGAFAPPTSLEDAASSNSSLFPERASPAELVRSLAGGDGRTAIGVFSNGERWNVSASLTGNLVAAQTFDEQLGFVGRASFVPFKGFDWVTHVGVNANLVIEPPASGPEIPGGAVRNVRLRERPELRVDATRLVDTNNIDADSATALGLELGAQKKSLYVQGEYFKIDVDRRIGLLPDPDFSGWYAQGGWLLTGGARRYSTATAGFDGPRVTKPFDWRKGQWGEIELAARYSHLDLNFREGTGTLVPVGSIRGGEQDVISLGVNWYLNNVVNLEFAYRDVSVDRLSPGGAAFIAGSTPPAGAQVGQDLNIWSLRTQYAF